MIDAYTHTLMLRPVTQDMTTRQLRLLALTSESTTGITIRHTAAMMKVPKPSVTRAADALTKMGLAVRVPDPSDRRSVFVKITKDGRKLLGDINRDLKRAFDAVERRLATETKRRAAVMATAPGVSGAAAG